MSAPAEHGREQRSGTYVALIVALVNEELYFRHNTQRLYEREEQVFAPLCFGGTGAAPERLAPANTNAQTTPTVSGLAGSSAARVTVTYASKRLEMPCDGWSVDDA